MREDNWRQQPSPSPKHTPSLLPPLSKFYYGPAQGWGSNESSPSHNGSTGSLNTNHDMSPALPPRPSGSHVTHRSPQSSQGWHSPSAPTTSQLAHMPYMSNSWASNPGSTDTPINSTWDSDAPDVSTGGVRYRHNHPRVPESTSKPPLPPRPILQPDQLHSYDSKVLSSRISATTIDVPLYLQPIAYGAPPIPGHFPLSPSKDRDHIHSPPEPQRLPPLPPQKLPLGKGIAPKVAAFSSKRPQYGFRRTFDREQQQGDHSSQRPHLVLQNSLDTSKISSQWQHQEQQPTVSAPQFTDFDIDSALSHRRPDQEPSLSLRFGKQHSDTLQCQPDADRYQAGQRLHQSLLSPTGPNEREQWTHIAKPWGSHVGYTPYPEQQLPVSISQELQSVSNTDLSFNTAGKSTPESQQSSDTSYRESDDHSDRSRHYQEGDDSFYWHSGRSSSGAEEDNSQCDSPAATPGQARVDQRSSTTHSTARPHEHPSLSPSTHTSYSAFALGFGGPSDWEYFGDYEAEEIDDEELYSRPRPRDTVRAYEGSAELPADPSFDDFIQRPSLSELSVSRSMLQVTPPLASGSPAMQQVTNRSEKAMNSKSSLGGEDIAKKSPVSAQSSTTPRPLSKGCAAPLNLTSDQRPDLDDVIRAWSEAPLEEKLRQDAAILHDAKDDYDEPPDVAEASLASTPRERMFGVDVIMKNAPSLPTSPTSNNQARSVATQNNSTSPTVPTHKPSVTQSLAEHSSCEKTEDVSNNLCKNAQTVSSEDGLTSTGQVRSNSMEVDTDSPRSDPLVLSLPRYTIPAKPVAATNLSLDPPAPTELTDRLLEGTASARHEVTQMQLPRTVQPQTPQETTQGSGCKIARTVLGDIIPDEANPCRPTSPLGPNAPPKHPTLTPTYQPSPSRQASPETDSLVSLEETTLTGSIKNLTDKEYSVETKEIDHAEPSQIRLSEDSKISRPKLTVKYVPTTKEASSADVLTERLLEKVGAVQGPQPPGAPIPPIVQSSQILLKTHKPSDPYADLDPWGKASLNRFAAMLREEARAENNKDKLNIFNVFTSRESRLRVVLYGTEDELVFPQKQIERQTEFSRLQEAAPKPGIEGKPSEREVPEENSFVEQTGQRANIMSLQRSLKALPALPSDRDSKIGLIGGTLAPLVVRSDSKTAAGRNGAVLNLLSADAQYNPDGNPVAARLSEESEQSRPDTPQDIVASAESVAGANADRSPSSNAPVAPRPKGAEMEKPTFTSPEYNEPRSEVKNYLANRKSVVRAYATLTQGSLESGSTFGKRLDIDRIPTLDNSIVARRSQYNQDAPSIGADTSKVTMKSKSSVTESQHNVRRFVTADFESLIGILPEPEALVIGSARLEDLRHVMEAVPDDFSFIHQSVVTWDGQVKKQREENDRQRYGRQMESEQRIDSLFDDHEIGYGDISELESEFKRSEAARKADEDRSEYQMFVSDVFNLVWTRLHYELDQLIPRYEQYSKLMNDTLAGKEMFDGSPTSLALAPTMSSFLGLHQKIELRQQKAFEAVLERDRRLKKTEISPWYTLSNITKVKQLEKQFEDAEKKAIIEYCQQRDTRANRLMDVLDQNTLRGVGANQDYMEAIMKAVRRIASEKGIQSAAGPTEPAAGVAEVKKAKDVATTLATSSEQIVQTFHVADMLLNSADYEVSVAEAKVAKADMATLTKLKEERAKEDQKLMRDLEHRLALIREDTRRTNDEITKLMLLLGVQDGGAGSGASLLQAGSGSRAADPGHEAGLHPAWEEAKRRNATEGLGG